MSAKNAPAKNRHGVRAAGKTATSISLSEELLAKARDAAEQDGRSLSNWIEQQLKEALKAAGKLGVLALAAFHLLPSADLLCAH